MGASPEGTELPSRLRGQMRVDRVLLGLEMTCSARGLDLGCLPVILWRSGLCPVLGGETRTSRRSVSLPRLTLKAKKGEAIKSDTVANECR